MIDVEKLLKRHENNFNRYKQKIDSCSMELKKLEEGLDKYSIRKEFKYEVPTHILPPVSDGYDWHSAYISWQSEDAKRFRLYLLGYHCKPCLDESSVIRSLGYQKPIIETKLLARLEILNYIEEFVHELSLSILDNVDADKNQRLKTLQDLSYLVQEKSMLATGVLDDHIIFGDEEHEDKRRLQGSYASIRSFLVKFKELPIVPQALIEYRDLDDFLSSYVTEEFIAPWGGSFSGSKLNHVINVALKPMFDYFEFGILPEKLE